MKARLRKIALISCAIFFAFFSILIQPHEQVKAGPVALLPAGLQGAAGVYVIGGLLVAAGAGLVGYDEYGEEIKAHSMRAWDNATQLSKDSMDLIVSGATGAGTGLVNMQGDFLNYIDGKLADLSNSAANIQAVGSIPLSETVSNLSAYGLTMSTNSYKTEIIISYTAGFKETTKSQFFLYGSPTYSGMATRINTAQNYTVANGAFVGMTEHTRATFDAILAQYNSITTAKEAVAFALQYSTGVSMQLNGQADIPEIYNNGLSRTREAWESMRDAGLVLPVDEFVPMTVDGQPLTYNPTDGSLTGIDGNVHTGEVDWRIPNIKWREKSDSIPQAGVWVDLPTYVPEIDGAAPPTDIPHTTTHITTGTTVGNPDIATDVPYVPTVPPPVTPPPPYIPPFEEGGTTGLDFTPLMASGDVMSRKFPFSIPFDFVRQIQVFNVEPEAPVFQVRVPEYLQIEQVSIPMNFDIDLTMFDTIALILRWGGVIVFDIGLIFAIRKFLPE